MATLVDDSNGNQQSIMIDETYEFSAPHFFDFVNGESVEDKCEAELWFDTALAYAPSRMFPFLISDLILVLFSFLKLNRTVESILGNLGFDFEKFLGFLWLLLDLSIMCDSDEIRVIFVYN